MMRFQKHGLKEDMNRVSTLTRKPIDGLDGNLDVHVPEDSSSFSKHDRDYYALSDISKIIETEGELNDKQKDLLKDVATRRSLGKDLRELISEDDTLDSLLRFVRYIVMMEKTPEMMGECNVREFNQLSDELGIRFVTVSNDTELKNLVKTILNGDNLKGIDLNWIDVSKVTTMKELFKDTGFRGYVERWDVSNVKNMKSMFEGCEEFDCDLSAWNVENVDDMTLMFSKCKRFNQPLTAWNEKLKKLEDAAFMFEGCEMFDQDLSGWWLESIKKCDFMFSGCNIRDEFIPWDDLKGKYTHLQ